MAKYRKKPVEIEARELMDTVESQNELIKWIGGEAKQGADGGILLQTLETKRYYAATGDFVIKGIRGEFYSCKPDIFEATYNKV